MCPAQNVASIAGGQNFELQSPGQVMKNLHRTMNLTNRNHINLRSFSVIIMHNVKWGKAQENILEICSLM